MVEFTFNMRQIDSLETTSVKYTAFIMSVNYKAFHALKNRTGKEL